MTPILLRSDAARPDRKSATYLAPGSARSTRCKDQTYCWPWPSPFFFGWSDSFIFGCKKLLTNLVFRLSALLGKGLYFAGDVCTIETRPEGVPGIPSDPTGSKHKALCTCPAWYWITMPGAGACAHRRRALSASYLLTNITSNFKTSPCVGGRRKIARTDVTACRGATWTSLPSGWRGGHITRRAAQANLPAWSPRLPQRSSCHGSAATCPCQRFEAMEGVRCAQAPVSVCGVNAQSPARTRSSRCAVNEELLDR